MHSARKKAAQFFQGLFWSLGATLGAADAMTGKIVIGGMIEIDLNAKRTSRGRPKITVKARAENPIAMLMGEITRRPSASVMPLMRVMTQKALSVIQDTGLLPAPIAIAR